MGEHSDHHQYVAGAAAGYTCLGLALLAYLVETPLVSAGWLPARTPVAVVGVGMAVLFLFSASRAYTRALTHRPATGAAPDPDPPAGWSVAARAVLLTVAVGLLVEAFAVGSEAVWHLPGSAGP